MASTESVWPSNIEAIDRLVGGFPVGHFTNIVVEDSPTAYSFLARLPVPHVIDYKPASILSDILHACDGQLVVVLKIADVPKPANTRHTALLASMVHLIPSVAPVVESTKTTLIFVTRIEQSWYRADLMAALRGDDYTPIDATPKMLKYQSRLRLRLTKEGKDYRLKYLKSCMAGSGQGRVVLLDADFNTIDFNPDYFPTPVLNV